MRRFEDERIGFGHRECGMREEFGHGRPCHRHEGRRPPFEGHPFAGREFREPNDLESMFMVCARMLRHDKRNCFGSTQDRILMILQENGGTMGQKALQELLHVQPGSISEVLSKMEEKQLIERSKDEDDRRASLISLKNKDFRAENESSFFSVLSEEEKENLKTILKKILDQRKEAEEE